MAVVCVNPERSPLASFFLESLLARKIASAAGARALAGFERRIFLQAGEMKVTLAFRGTAVEIHPGEVAPWDAAVVADLATLLQLGLGRGYVWPFVTGRLRMRGNPLPLLTLLRLFRAPEPPATAAAGPGHVA